MSEEKLDQNYNPIKKLKNILWPLGVWPFSDNYFSTLRTIIFLLIQVMDCKKNC